MKQYDNQGYGHPNDYSISEVSKHQEEDHATPMDGTEDAKGQESAAAKGLRQVSNSELRGEVNQMQYKKAQHHLNRSYDFQQQTPIPEQQ